MSGLLYSFIYWYLMLMVAMVIFGFKAFFLLLSGKGVVLFIENIAILFFVYFLFYWVKKIEFLDSSVGGMKLISKSVLLKTLFMISLLFYVVSVSSATYCWTSSLGGCQLVFSIALALSTFILFLFLHRAVEEKAMGGSVK